MIRLATEGDIPAILAIYAPYIQETAYSFEYTVPTETEFAARFRHHTHYCPWLVWEEDGTVLGYAYGAPAYERAAYQWCAEVSIYLSPQAQGRGIGNRLYAALEKLLTLQGYRVFYAVVTDVNTGSVAFHQALGYRITAHFPRCGFKFSRWVGTIWLEKRPDFGDISVIPPVLWSEFVNIDGNFRNILDILSLS